MFFIKYLCQDRIWIKTRVLVLINLWLIFGLKWPVLWQLEINKAELLHFPLLSVSFRKFPQICSHAIKEIKVSYLPSSTPWNVLKRLIWSLIEFYPFTFMVGTDVQRQGKEKNYSLRSRMYNTIAMRKNLFIEK